jgi:hypothetical protein
MRLLRLQHVNQRGPVARVLLRAAYRVAPRRRLHGIAGVQLFDALEVVGVVSGERADPRKVANVDALGLQAAGGRNC